VLRRTADGVTLVAGAGGPLGGDDLHLDIDVTAGAALRLGSAAAMIVQPGRARTGEQARAARLTVRADVGAGASLRWEPEPTVVAAGASLEAHARVRCGPGASLVWREILVLGRHDQRGGTVTSTLVVDIDARPLLRQTTNAGPGAPPGWDGPAGFGGHRVLGTMLLLGEVARAVAPRARSGAVPHAVLPLEAGGVLVTALGATTLDVRRILAATLSGPRQVGVGEAVSARQP
jgi:urease accessory protein